MRFSLAGIDLGSAAGASQLTPMDIVDGPASLSDPAVLNLSRFLQSLDADGNLGNGIEITADIKNAISERSVGIQRLHGLGQLSTSV